MLKESEENLLKKSRKTYKYNLLVIYFYKLVIVQRKKKLESKLLKTI